MTLDLSAQSSRWLAPRFGMARAREALSGLPSDALSSAPAKCRLPTKAPESRLENVFLQARRELSAQGLLSDEERRVLRQLVSCRTGALGESIVQCSSPACDYGYSVFYSCRDRHCPRCQNLDQTRWMRHLEKKLLVVSHYHVVLTLPSELRPLGRRHPKDLFEALFRAGSAALADLGRRFDVTLGYTMVLHTWTRDVRFHPHLHAIVTAGGLADDGTFLDLSEVALFPNDLLAESFRKKMLVELRGLAHLIDDFTFNPSREALAGLPEIGRGPRRILAPRKARRRGPRIGPRPKRPKRDREPEPKDPARFAAWLDSLTRLNLKRWVVYAKVTFGSPAKVVGYLGRYTRRVAISESRIVEATETQVVFSTKDGKTETLTPRDFTRRFLLHVLPHGYPKLRHYGLYATANGKRKLPLARAAHAKLHGIEYVAPAPAVTDTLALLTLLTGRDAGRCPKCGEALLPLIKVRGPPWERSWAA